jgi:ubiquinone/menaquinone biosynthesis C-methylase UbiE
MLQVLNAVLGDARCRVLDLGCGTSKCVKPLPGALGSEPLTSVEFHSSVVELSSRGHDAVGIDISQAAIEAARGRGAPFIVGDVTAMPFRHASFDVVLDKATFDVRAQHLNSPPSIAHDSPNLELQFRH